MRIHPLPLGFAALVLLAGCANTARTTPDSPGLAAGPAAAPAAGPAAQPEAKVAAFPPPHVRFAVVQSAAPVAVTFVDPELGDLRAPKRVLGERTFKGLQYGATPGAIFMYPGSPPQLAAAGAVLSIVGGAIGGLTGLLAGAIEDGVTRAGIPLEQIHRETPTLVAAASDLVHGPQALGDCVSERLAAPRPPSQVTAGDADETPSVSAPGSQGASHALVLQEIELQLMRTGDRRSYAPKAQARYSVYEMDDEPRLLWQSSVQIEGPARSLDAWTAAGASELRALAARACPLLAEDIGAEVAARLAPADQ